MNSSCLCGKNKDTADWKNDECCDFHIQKYEYYYNDYYLKLNNNIYTFDNHSSNLILNDNLWLKSSILIDETLPIENIRAKIISIVSNICFM